MSVQVAIFERMFDHGEVPALALASPQPTPSAVEALQARINAMQRTTLDTKLTPTHEALADLLPDGGLKQGAAYSVTSSSALVMALLAGPSQAGSWCGVVGMPEFGVEAAESLGIDLDRLVLVPHPGDQWLTVTAAIADAMSVIVVKPGRAASDGAVTKLAGRLRDRGATLLVVGTWPQTEAMISITASRWSGLGQGWGYLTEREVTVTVSSRRSATPRSGRLVLPDPELGIRRLDPPLGAGRGRLGAAQTGGARPAPVTAMPRRAG